MSSIMRRRNGLMGFSLIGGSCLEVGVLDPSILKTEHPPRHPSSIKMVTGLNAHGQRPCRLFPRERVRSVAHSGAELLWRIVRNWRKLTPSPAVVVVADVTRHGAFRGRCVNDMADAGCDPPGD